MMRIIFVRHGHPDYIKNCLTEIGHKQAEAAAQRLSGLEKLKRAWYLYNKYAIFRLPGGLL